MCHAVQPGAHLLYAPTSPLFAVMQARNYTPLRSQRLFVGSPEPIWASTFPATSNAVLPAQPSLSNAVVPAQPFRAVLPAQPSLSNAVLPAQPYLSSNAVVPAQPFDAVLPAQPSLFNAVLPAQPSLSIPVMPSPGGHEEEHIRGESPQTTAPFTVTNKSAPAFLSPYP